METTPPPSREIRYKIRINLLVWETHNHFSFVSRHMVLKVILPLPERSSPCPRLPVWKLFTTVDLMSPLFPVYNKWLRISSSLSLYPHPTQHLAHPFVAPHTNFFSSYL